MKLTINNNCSFTMSLNGYEFPELEDVEYDSNWLNVKIDVRHQRGDWSAIDPALLTYEVQWLIDWLKALGVGKYEERHLYFMEPCLSFYLMPAEGVPDKLVVKLAYNFAPPWASKNFEEQHELVFQLSTIDLFRAAQSLESQLSQYPQRTER